MARNREPMKLADFLVIALNPALVMAMVGTLVFFLVEVLYVGQYQGTLLYILFFFVIGGVLVARISIEFNDSRATLYGAILGGLTWLGTLRYVEYSQGTFAGQWSGAINLALLAVIWWSSYQLTWDCTVIDDSQDASGAGLLQMAGIEEDKDASPSPDATAESVDRPSGDEGQSNDGRKKKRRQPGPAAITAWLERYRAYRDERSRLPHAPGVWVVYFSLAALPLYGIGQSLIPPADSERRQYVFWLMSIYVAAGLGLLLTTSFLGLRRYLRQKKLQMPWKITASWMSIGVTLIAAFLLLGALLPRPSAEYAIIQLPWQPGSKEQDADRNAVRGDEAGKGESRRGVKGKDDDAKNAQDKGKGKDAAGKKDDGKAKGDGKKDDSKGKDGDKSKAEGAKQKDKANDREQQAKGNEPQQQPPGSFAEKAAEVMAKLAALLRPILIGVMILVVLFVVGRALLQFLANFTGWAAGLLKFLRRFWKNREGKNKDPAEADAKRSAEPPPFAEFSNPFLSGKAKSMSPAELVHYTFEALESWSWTRHLARQPGETPHEFAERLGEERPAMDDCARQLANDYAGLAYAGATLNDDCRESIRQCWRQMSGADSRVASPVNSD